MGVDHDKIILLSTPFPTTPMLGKTAFPHLLLSLSLSLY